MVRYLESLPYIWCFLQKERSLISSLDPAVVARRDDLTQDLDFSRVQEFIPDQKIDFLDS